MGMTADDLLQRLRACEAVLSDCDVGTHSLLSQGQSDVVLGMMSLCTISPNDIGPVTEAILKCRWAEPSHKTALLKMVGSLTHMARPRAKLQDFESLAMFIPEQMWADLLNHEIDYHSKAALLCDHAVALQLRHPTEPTVGCMIALLLLCTEGPVKARSTSPAFQHDLCVSLKEMLKKRMKTAPVKTIAKLGSDPALFMVQHPDIFAAVFATGAPVRPKVTMAEITVISNSINLRNRKGGREKTMNPFATSSSSSSSSGGDPFQAMMQQFIMQSMGAMLNRPAAGSMLLPGGAQLQLFGGGAAPLPAAVQIPVQPRLALAAEMPLELAAPPVTAIAAAPLAPPLDAAALPKRSVDDAAAAIMDAMGKRADTREEKRIAMKRPAAAETAEKPLAAAETAKKPPAAAATAMKRPAAAATGKPDKSSSPLFSVEASRSQVLYRSGLLGKGQTKVFKYSNEKEKKRALASAEALVVAEKRRRCL
jgi:hypothetical protein